jgi:hypothetical protein
LRRLDIKVLIDYLSWYFIILLAWFIPCVILLNIRGRFIDNNVLPSLFNISVEINTFFFFFFSGRSRRYYICDNTLIQVGWIYYNCKASNGLIINNLRYLWDWGEVLDYFIWNLIAVRKLCYKILNYNCFI